MDIREKIKLTKKNIWEAIDDYKAHTSNEEVLNDVTDKFVNRLAEDSVIAKEGLREMFRKSPAWNEELDALVINGSRTHEPNYDRVRDLIWEIIRPALYRIKYNDKKYWAVKRTIRLFITPYTEEAPEEAIQAIKELAPKAYAPGKKLSRVFKALCVALNIADENPGSEFQKLYAQLADEISSRKIDFKLFVSLNPAHFLTMSNPKHDERGDTLTSCHSFNSTEYEYNNGCSGYARDGVTMIAFTASDPDDPETLNNRKTTRQLFMYKPGGGVLLQSRMYNTSGGTEGAQAESKVYRDLIQREISECEGVPNLWKTVPYMGNRFNIIIPRGPGFGGYVDWRYDDFDPKISVRKDNVEDPQEFSAGTFGLCIVCGKEIAENLYCDDCNEKNKSYCDDCGHYCDEKDLYEVQNHAGETIRVCSECIRRYYTHCCDCGIYYPDEDMTQLHSGYYVCPECRDRYYRQCDDCSEWYRGISLREVTDENGDTIHICAECNIARKRRKPREEVTQQGGVA